MCFVRKIIDYYKKGGLKLVGYLILDRVIPKDEAFFSKLNPDKYPKYLKRFYYKRLNKELDLDCPKTGN